MSTESKHTKEPWLISGAVHVYAPGEDGANIASVSEPRAKSEVGYTPLTLGSPDFNEACDNAQRIVAAVNACEGIPQAELETLNVAALREAAVEAQGALRSSIHYNAEDGPCWCDEYPGVDDWHHPYCQDAQKALRSLASALGEAQTAGEGDAP